MWEGVLARSAHDPPPITPTSPAALANLGVHTRDVYRAHFAHELAAGRVRPMVLPWALLGGFVAPALYLAVPHARRPWLRRAGIPLFLLIAVLNVHEALVSSSANFAVGYGIGLLQAWGVLWSATLLVWSRPQLEAERVERRRRRGGLSEDGSVDGDAGRGSGMGGLGSEVASNGRILRSRGSLQNGHKSQNGHRSQNGHKSQNGHSTGPPIQGAVNNLDRNEDGTSDMSQAAAAADEDIARSLQEGYEYYWQAFPADAPFSTRLGWSLDLVTTFRGTGWNWCVPVIPHFAKPEKPLSGALVDLTSIPLRTRQGYRRYTTSREWLRAKLGHLLLGYLSLDLLSVIMMKDPYFILGPDFANATADGAAAVALPPYLASLPSLVLFTYRSLVCFAAIFLAIENIFLCAGLFAHFVLRRLYGTRAELWHFPSVFGSFIYGVADRGMAGFWGAWWHQTFRTAFAAPGLWLTRKGYIDSRSPRGKAAIGLLAFAQSGFLHCLGSVSCVPPGKPWQPPTFFLLSWAGLIVQVAWTAALRAMLGRESPMPSTLRRAGNVVFVFAWLNAVQFLLADDFARAGVWLLEPVPASLFRGLGLGKPGDSWWRWDAFLLPGWYRGSRWWLSGISM